MFRSARDVVSLPEPNDGETHRRPTDLHGPVSSRKIIRRLEQEPHALGAPERLARRSHPVRELPDYRNSELRPLTQKSLALAARELAARDEMLAGIHAAYGDPPLWRRATGFTTLVHIILEQQVSLKSAKAMLVRLQGIIEQFTPERFVELGYEYLRGLGVTRQKSAYLLDL